MTSFLDFATMCQEIGFLTVIAGDEMTKLEFCHRLYSVMYTIQVRLAQNAVASAARHPLG